MTEQDIQSNEEQDQSEYIDVTGTGFSSHKAAISQKAPSAVKTVLGKVEAIRDTAAEAIGAGLEANNQFGKIAQATGLTGAVSRAADKAYEITGLGDYIAGTRYMAELFAQNPELRQKTWESFLGVDGGPMAQTTAIDPEHKLTPVQRAQEARKAQKVQADLEAKGDSLARAAIKIGGDISTGLLNLAGSAAQIGQELLDVGNPEAGQSDPRVGEHLFGKLAELVQNMGQVLPGNKPFVEDPSVQTAVGSIGKGIPSQIPPYIAYALGGPAAGALTGALMESAGYYDELLKENPNIDRRQAAGRATLYGGASYILNNYAFRKLAEVGASVPGVQGFIKRLLAQGGREGGTEYLEEVTTATDKFITHKDPKLYLKDLKDGAEVILTAAVSGGGMSAAEHVQSMWGQSQIEAKSKEAEKKIYELGLFSTAEKRAAMDDVRDRSALDEKALEDFYLEQEKPVTPADVEAAKAGQPTTSQANPVADHRYAGIEQPSPTSNVDLITGGVGQQIPSTANRQEGVQSAIGEMPEQVDIQQVVSDAVANAPAPERTAIAPIGAVAEGKDAVDRSALEARQRTAQQDQANLAALGEEKATELAKKKREEEKALAGQRTAEANARKAEANAGIAEAKLAAETKENQQAFIEQADALLEPIGEGGETRIPMLDQLAESTEKAKQDRIAEDARVKQEKIDQEKQAEKAKIDQEKRDEAMQGQPQQVLRAQGEVVKKLAKGSDQRIARVKQVAEKIAAPLVNMLHKASKTAAPWVNAKNFKSAVSKIGSITNFHMIDWLVAHGHIIEATKIEGGKADIIYALPGTAVPQGYVVTPAGGKTEVESVLQRDDRTDKRAEAAWKRTEAESAKKAESEKKSESEKKTEDNPPARKNVTNSVKARVKTYAKNAGRNPKKAPDFVATVLQKLIPNAEIEQDEDGDLWVVAPNGASFLIRTTEGLTTEKDYDAFIKGHPELKGKKFSGLTGVFQAVQGTEIVNKDGETIPASSLIALSAATADDIGKSDETDLEHELVHVADFLGLFTPKERAALIKQARLELGERYEKTPDAEMLAIAIALPDNRGMVEKLIDRIVEAIGSIFGTDFSVAAKAYRDFKTGKLFERPVNLAQRPASVNWGVQAVQGAARVTLTEEDWKNIRDEKLLTPDSVGTNHPDSGKYAEIAHSHWGQTTLEMAQRIAGKVESDWQMISEFEQYHGLMFDPSKYTNPLDGVKAYIKYVASNTRWLYDQVNENVRQVARRWYEGAHNVAQMMADEYGLTISQAAGMMAAMSPNAEWNSNVANTHRIMEIMSRHSDEVFTPEMESTLKNQWEAKGKGLYQKYLAGVKGKTLSEISSIEMKAAWVRAYSETYYSQNHYLVHPDGFLWKLRLPSGEYGKVKPQSLDNIEKAVAIYLDGSRASLSENVGYGHKVRSFYNNIVDPSAIYRIVTADTHSVAGGVLLPIGGDHGIVKNHFGQGITKISRGPMGSGQLGLYGLYYMYADAIRQVADEVGLEPREIQSITWEAVKGLFSTKFKQANNLKKISAIMAEVKSGGKSIEKGREEILEIAGGIQEPDWSKSGFGIGETKWYETNPGKLPPIELRSQLGSGSVGPRATVRTPAGNRGQGRPVRRADQRDAGQDQGGETLASARDTEPKMVGSGKGTRKFFSAVVKGDRDKSTVSYKPVLDIIEKAAMAFDAAYNKRRGNFDDHIAKSIPGFREIQTLVGSAIAKIYGKSGAKMIDIGASEGGIGKTISEVSYGKIETVSIDPNRDMAKAFAKEGPVPGATYSVTAFGAGWTEDDGFVINPYNPGEPVDIAHESMTFQFLDSPDAFVERAAQFAEVKRMLKPDGVFITEEKIVQTPGKEDEWVRREEQKDDYKRQYFPESELARKKAEVIEGMHGRMVNQDQLEQRLEEKWKYVAQFWHSTNFVGYIASDSKESVTNLLEAIGDTNSEYSGDLTPRWTGNEHGGPMASARDTEYTPPTMSASLKTRIIEAMRSIYNSTDVPHKARWILPDGTMLTEHRDVAHREMAEKVLESIEDADQLLADTETSTPTIIMTNAGIARVGFDFPFAHFSAPLTPRQITIIAENMENEPFARIDLADSKGRTVEAETFSRDSEVKIRGRLRRMNQIMEAGGTGEVMASVRGLDYSKKDKSDLDEANEELRLARASGDEEAAAEADRKIRGIERRAIRNSRSEIMASARDVKLPTEGQAKKIRELAKTMLQETDDPEHVKFILPGGEWMQGYQWPSHVAIADPIITKVGLQTGEVHDSLDMFLYSGIMRVGENGYFAQIANKTTAAQRRSFIDLALSGKQTEVSVEVIEPFNYGPTSKSASINIEASPSKIEAAFAKLERVRTGEIPGGGIMASARDIEYEKKITVPSHRKQEILDALYRGLTRIEDPAHARFMMPDGQYYRGDEFAHEHADVAIEVFEKELPWYEKLLGKEAWVSGNMFTQVGAARMYYSRSPGGTGGLNLSTVVPLTRAQINSIIELSAYSKNPSYIDVTTVGSRVIAEERILPNTSDRMVELSVGRLNAALKYGGGYEVMASARVDDLIAASPAPPAGHRWAFHWSGKTLTELDPEFHGSGIRGAEAKRKAAYPDIYIPRIYAGVEGYVKEMGLGSQRYRLAIQADRLYDFEKDPDGLIQKTRDWQAQTGEMGNPAFMSKLESLVRDAGYLGYESMNVVALFEKISPESRVDESEVMASARDVELPTKEQAQKIRELAKTMLKKTNDHRMAQFILPDGTWVIGGDGYEHAGSADQIITRAGFRTKYLADSLEILLSTGIMRVGSMGYFAQIATTPTRAQVESFSDLVLSNNRDETYIELTDPLNSTGINGAVDSDASLSGIKNAFAKLESIRTGKAQGRNSSPTQDQLDTITGMASARVDHDPELTQHLQDIGAIQGDVPDGDEPQIAFGSARPEQIPEKTVRVYKVMELRNDGKLYPLFLGAKKPVPTGEWLAAEIESRAGFADRPGWHAGLYPVMPQTRSKAGTISPGRVWVEADLGADVDWQSVANQSRTKDIKGRIPIGGYYEHGRYPGWVIGGEIYVHKIMTPEEVEQILRERGESEETIKAETSYSPSVLERMEVIQNGEEGRQATEVLGEAGTGPGAALASARPLAQSLRDVWDSPSEYVRTYLKARKMTDENDRQDLGTFDTMLRTIQHYSKKVPALREIWQAAMSLKDNKHSLELMVFNDSQGRSDIQKVTDLNKTNPAQYSKLNTYLFDKDRAAQGYRATEAGEFWAVLDPSGKRVDRTDTEEAAWMLAYDLEAQDRRRAGWSKAQVDALLAVRHINHRAYGLLKESAETLKKVFDETGRELPTITVDGKPIDLWDALRQMGDRRGYWMPRIRKSGKYQLIATKGAERRLEIADTAVGRDLLAADLIRQGYQVRKRLSDRPSEEVFLEGDIAALNDMMMKALDRMRKQVKDEANWNDFGIEARRIQYQRQDGGTEDHLVIQAPPGKDISDLLKMFGGRWYKKDKMWHWVAPSKALELKIFRAMTRTQLASLPQDLFAQNVLQQVAEMIHSRGSRSSKIGRSDDVNEDVWLGYEEDTQRAVTRSAKAVVGGTAKRIMARQMAESLMGTQESWKDFLARNTGDRQGMTEEETREANQKLWDDYQNEVREKRIDSGLQPRAYLEATSFMKEMLRNEEPSERIIGAIKGLASLKYLSGIAPALVNLTALPTTVAGTMLGNGIPLSRIAPLLARAMTNHTSHWIYRKWGRGAAPSGENGWLFDEISKRGWDEPLLHMEAMAALEGQARGYYRLAMDWAMLPFAVAEKMNRGATIAASYYGLKELHRGPWNEAAKLAALEKAKQISDDANATYGKTNLPALARGSTVGAQVFRSWYMYKTFSHNYLQLMYHLGVEKKDAKSALYLALSPAIIAGPGVFVATPLITGMIKAIMSVLGYEPPDDMMEAFYDWAEETFGTPGQRLARNGVVGLFGVNLKGSLSTGITDIPTTLQDLLGAPAGLVKDVGQAGVALGRGDVLLAAEKAAPRFAAAPIRAAREATRGVATKDYHPAFYGEEQIVPGAGATILRSLGFNPVEVSEKTEKQWSEYQVKAEYEKIRDEIYARIRLHAQTEGDAANWLDILSDAEAFNQRIEAHQYQFVPLITDRGINSILKNSTVASRAEMRREKPEEIEAPDLEAEPEYQEPAGRRGGYRPVRRGR